VFVERIITADRSARTAMAAALVVVAAVATYGWTVSPHLAYLQAVQSYEPVVKNVADRKRDVADALAAKRRDLQTLEDEFAMLRRRCFTPVQARQFFASVDRLAQETDCAVASADFVFEHPRGEQETAPDRPAVVIHRAHLTVLGGYDGLLDWLERLQRRPQEVCIDSFSLELVDGRSGRLKCHLTAAIWVVLNKGDLTNG